MAGPKCAEDFINSCQCCGGGQKLGLVVTPKRSAPNEFWALCPDCYESEGKVWWAKCNIKYTVERRNKSAEA